MHTFIRDTLRGSMITWREDHPWFAYQCFIVFFWVTLPYADERLWRLEGGGLSCMEYILNHSSCPSDVIQREYVKSGTQTDDAIIGMMPDDNAVHEAETILAAQACVGLPRHSEVECQAETWRLRREQ